MEQLELFADQLETNTLSFSQLLDRVIQNARTDEDYHICRHDNMMVIADLIENVKGLSMEDRYSYTKAPAMIQDPMIQSTVLKYCMAHANGSSHS